MNKVLTFLFIAILNECNAATGNASDGQLLAIVVIGLMLLIIGTGYFIDFMKSKIKEFKTGRLIKKNNIDNNGEFINSFNKAIPELVDGIITY